MRELGKIVLHIPAREGSKRVPRKNMRLMNGKPMISYTIESTIKAEIPADMYINTDSEEMIEFIRKNYPEFNTYKRANYLANDTASSDEFNLDIILNLSADTLIMINPVCPLITTDDIKKAFEAFKNSNCDTLITTESTQMQTFCNNIPVNININEQLAPSQKNSKISILNWAITIWDAKAFKDRMQGKGFASLGINRLFFDIDSMHAIKISEEKDFLFAEKLLSIS